MTAAEANRPNVRERIRAACRRRGRTVTDRLVHDWLAGWPVRDGTDELLCAVADDLGIDTTTCPRRTPEAVAAWQASRRGKTACPECARLRREVEELRRQIEVSRTRHLAAVSSGAPF
jgi:hypothetical protein